MLHVHSINIFFSIPLWCAHLSQAHFGLLNAYHLIIKGQYEVVLFVWFYRNRFFFKFIQNYIRDKHCKCIFTKIASFYTQFYWIWFRNLSAILCWAPQKHIVECWLLMDFKMQLQLCNVYCTLKLFQLDSFDVCIWCVSTVFICKTLEHFQKKNVIFPLHIYEKKKFSNVKSKWTFVLSEVK